MSSRKDISSSGRVVRDDSGDGTGIDSLYLDGVSEARIVLYILITYLLIEFCGFLSDPDYYLVVFLSASGGNCKYHNYSQKHA